MRNLPQPETHSDSAGGSVSLEEGQVRGERGRPSVARTRSLQSRLSSILACSLVMLLGGGLLTWYYANAFSRQSRVRQAERTAAAGRAQGESVLPALGGIAVPAPQPSKAVVREPADTETVATAATSVPPAPAESAPLLSLSQSQGWAPIGQAPAPPYGTMPAKTPAQVAYERRTSGAAFARNSDSRAVNTQSPTFSSQLGPNTLAAPDGNGPARPAGELPALLQPAALASARADVLQNKRLLLPKGAFIDCTLETAIDSTLPGMTTCITATDTFGVDGDVVLLERGTKLTGETRGQVQQGAARLFVLWTQARTPAGVIVPLDSPGTDELGRAGLSGEVQHHFWQRFGAAILISTLDGGVQAAVQSAGHGGGPVIYDPAPSQGIATDVLKGTVNIPPTITKRNGDRIQVLVARDLDFRSVYELHPVATSR